MRDHHLCFHRVPPHLSKRRGIEYVTIMKSLGIGFSVTVIIALFMSAIGMPLTVIFPTSAPIWMGLSTMLFMAMKD